MNLKTLQNPVVRVGTTVGLMGGLALVSVPLLGLRGPMIYVPYTVLVLLLAFLSGLLKLDRSQRFKLVFTGYMVASLFLYLYLILIENPSALGSPLLGHAWRLGLLGTIGGIVALGASRA